MKALEAIGWSPVWAADLEGLDPEGTLAPGRVAEEHRGELVVLWAGGSLRAEVAGRLRYTASGPEDLPGVGDWVAVAPRPDEGRGTVVHVLPRRSALLRKAPERPVAAQLLAANVDTVLVVVSANQNFRARRIERILALARDGGAMGVVVLSKRDVAEDLQARAAEAAVAAGGAPLVVLSALTGEGVEELEPYLGAGRSAVLIGSSGVGKSTLANRLLGEERLATREIRAADDKGRHTTTHRQLLPLPTGGVLIDTPGLREFGLWGGDEEGVGSAFPEVEALLGTCRFADCGHGNEPGCSVRSALEAGTLDRDRWDSYWKLQREVEHLRSKRSARARHEHRKKMKKFSRQVRARMRDKDRGRRGD